VFRVHRHNSLDATTLADGGTNDLDPQPPTRAAAASRNRLAPPPAEKQTARSQASRNYGVPSPPKFLRRA